MKKWQLLSVGFLMIVFLISGVIAIEKSENEKMKEKEAEIKLKTGKDVKLTNIKIIK